MTYGWEKIFTGLMCTEELISRIDEKLLQSKNKKANNDWKNGQRAWTVTSAKKISGSNQQTY